MVISGYVVSGADCSSSLSYGNSMFVLLCKLHISAIWKNIKLLKLLAFFRDRATAIDRAFSLSEIVYTTTVFVHSPVPSADGACSRLHAKHCTAYRWQFMKRMFVVGFFRVSDAKNSPYHNSYCTKGSLKLQSDGALFGTSSVCHAKFHNEFSFYRQSSGRGMCGCEHSVGFYREYI